MVSKKKQKVEIANFEDINEERELFGWEAAERSFQRRNRDFWITAIAMFVLFSVILIFIQEFYLIIALLSILFLIYAYSTVPPERIKNKITNRGVYFGEFRYEWDYLVRFWFGKSLSSETLLLETRLKFPRQVSLIINPEDKEKLKKILVKRLPMMESSPTFIDKVTKWFGERLPLENREK